MIISLWYPPKAESVLHVLAELPLQEERTGCYVHLNHHDFGSFFFRTVTNELIIHRKEKDTECGSLNGFKTDMEEILTLRKPQINYNEAQMSQTEQIKSKLQVEM